MLRLSARAAAGVALPIAGLAGCSAESSTSPNSTDVEPNDSGSSVTGLPLPIPERLFGSVFNLEMRIGGREFLKDRTTPTKGYNGDFLGPTLVLRSGTEVWEITNPTTQAHPFHVHGDSFQVLTRNGFAPPEHELGWKDVVLVRPDETVRIIKRFLDYENAVSPYMFHCHILEHEDVGMMGQFVVEAGSS